MAHYYLRHKNNHRKIAAFGHEKPGQYEYDPDFLEEAEGPLPPDSIIAPMGTRDKLYDVFEEVAKHPGREAMLVTYRPEKPEGERFTVCGVYGSSMHVRVDPTYCPHPMIVLGPPKPDWSRDAAQS